MRQTEIGSFRSFFLFFPSKNQKKKKIEKMKKNCRRYHHFGHVYQKSQSYDVRLLRYRVRQTDFFCYFGPIFVFSPTTDPENQIWKNERNVLTYYPFTHMYHINEDYMAPAKKDNFLSFLVIFFTFTPLTIHKIRILKKWEIHLEILSFYLSVP